MWFQQNTSTLTSSPEAAEFNEILRAQMDQVHEFQREPFTEPFTAKLLGKPSFSEGERDIADTSGN